MLFNTQHYLFTACVLFAISTIGCTEGYPPPVHGQESSTAVESREDVDLSNQQQKPTRQYEVVATEADGSTTVQFSQDVFTPETRTSTMQYDDGVEVENTYTVWVPQTTHETVSVPSGEHVVDFLNESYPQTLPKPDTEEDVLYEIVEREPDGTTVVLVNVFDYQEEIRTRKITRHGRTVEQCYARYEPTLHEVVRIRVPAGQDILATVEDFQTAVSPPPAPAIEGIPAAPPAPVVQDIPPAPVVDSGA
jgi:hypothetical protein